VPAKSETSITTGIIDWIIAEGGDAWHVSGSMKQRRGEPDIDGFLPGGLHLKIEVKTTVGRPTGLQVKRIRVYKAAGYVAAIVTSIAELIEVLHEYGYEPVNSR
jgi:hypothetical protein